MKTTVGLTDKISIFLSITCAIHCLLFPMLLALIPTLASFQLNNEVFHLWMVVTVLPFSIFALTLGCKQHRRFYILGIGFLGLALLIGALALEGVAFGHKGEIVFTLLGAMLIAISHVLNYQLCSDKCVS